MGSWFDSARVGVFLHWGHSSQHPCELSWPMVGGNPALPNCGSMTVKEYQSTAATFNPMPFDPREWARLFKQAGAEYAVLTAKHHDGYAMFDTRLSDFSVMHSRYGKDIVAAFVEAMRAEGLRVGLYYSLSDWHHPDYPAFKDEHRPYMFGRQSPPAGPQEWDRYLDFMFGQVRELLTNYGVVDIIWFDGHWERTPDQWRASDLESMIRSLQPHILINDRLPGAGDFLTPEQFVPLEPPAQPWEVCLTMNESWGYDPADTQYKPARRIIHTICEIAGAGGRLLLNVSPDRSGRVPPEQLERLDAVAGWMDRNGDAIAGTLSGLKPGQFYGPSTRLAMEDGAERIFLHLLMRPYDTVTVRGVPVKRVRSVRALASQQTLRYDTRASILDTLLNADPLGEITVYVPEEALDEHATVIAVDFAPDASVVSSG